MPTEDEFYYSVVEWCIAQIDDIATMLLYTRF